MHFSATLLAAFAVVPAAVYAQNTHTVLVGDGGALAFNPSNITAAQGDKVAFEFRAKNHTVTQSTFAAPCVPAKFNGTAGADSGFLFISPNSTFQNGSFPTWTITVNSSGPLWFHCAQTTPKNHCQSGMVFSINATPEKSFDQYLAAAKAFDPSTLSSQPTDGSAPTNSSAPTDGSAPPTTDGTNGTDPSGASSSSGSGSVPNPTDPGSGASATDSSSAAPAAGTADQANAPANSTTGKSNGGEALRVGRGRAAGLLTVGAIVVGALLI